MVLPPDVFCALRIVCDPPMVSGPGMLQTGIEGLPAAMTQEWLWRHMGDPQTPEHARQDGEHLRHVLRKRCRKAGDLLDRSLNDCTASARSASWASIFYSSMPVTSSMLVWQFRLLNVLCGLGSVPV